MAQSSPRTTTIYMNDEDRALFAELMEQTGLTKSGLVRHLIKKAARGEEGSQTAELRTHVAALAKLVL